jgi:sugar phosphate isomerase/epimerase
MQHKHPFSVNQYLCPPGMPPADFLDMVARFGFQGAGVTQQCLEALPAADMARELAARNLTLTSVNSAGFFLQEGEAAIQQDKRNRWFLQQARELEHARLNVIVGGSATLSLSAARDLAATRLRAFAREAAEAGVQLMLEPLHHLNARTKSCFNSISQIRPLFDALPELTLNADLYHLWWDPDLDRLLRGDLLPLGLLQICDVGIPEGETVPRRVPLGEGFISWSEYVHATRQAFPGVSIELELFIDQLPGRDPVDILTSSAVALADFLEN